MVMMGVLYWCFTVRMESPIYIDGFKVMGFYGDDGSLLYWCFTVRIESLIYIDGFKVMGFIVMAVKVIWC